MIGVGSFAVPLMTRGEAAPDAPPGISSATVLHLLGIGLLLASFVVETWFSVRVGLALRGAVAATVLLLAGRLHRTPDRPGLLRWSIWIAAWCVPLGYAIAALSPWAVKGPLHVTFISGFGLLALSVSAQVILGHGGYERLKAGRPWPLAIAFVALALAVVARVMMVAREERLLLWTATAAALFLFATACWAGFLVPKLLRDAPGEQS